jgi:hypothetical protein
MDSMELAQRRAEPDVIRHRDETCVLSAWILIATLPNAVTRFGGIR